MAFPILSQLWIETVLLMMITQSDCMCVQSPKSE